MKINNIKIEDFVNYKKPSLFIGMGSCNWKCCYEADIPITECQNNELNGYKTEVEVRSLVDAYMRNSITQAIVIGGLEPFSDFINLLDLVSALRAKTEDDIVIYTGYYPHELTEYLIKLSEYDNIIIKFGRFKPNEKPVKDELLGVELASSNQYAVRLNKGSKEIIKAMQENSGFCPCMIKQSSDTLCCCKAFRNKKSGECHCGIFSK